MSSCYVLIFLALPLLVNLKQLWLNPSEDAANTNYLALPDPGWLPRDYSGTVKNKWTNKQINRSQTVSETDDHVTPRGAFTTLGSL